MLLCIFPKGKETRFYVQVEREKGKIDNLRVVVGISTPLENVNFNSKFFFLILDFELQDVVYFMILYPKIVSHRFCTHQNISNYAKIRGKLKKLVHFIQCAEIAKFSL